jgi:cell division protein FtsW
MHIDTKSIIILVGVLLMIGSIMIFSSTAVYAKEENNFSNPFFFLQKQVFWIYIGVLLTILVAHLPYPLWEKLGYLLLGIAVILLISVLIPGIGREVNGARRWIRIGGLGIQPSELARFSLVIFLAGFLTRHRENLCYFLKGVVKPLGIVFFIAMLVMLEPDIGTSFFIILSSTVLIVAGGVKLKHILPIIILASILGSIYALIKFPYVIDRINSFLHPASDPSGKGYQLRQSLIALGSGGLCGAGLGEGTQKLFFLPEARSDFIFPIIGEELGFLGSSFIVILYLLMLTLFWRILKRVNNPFGRLLAIGITLEIILQAIINISVACGVLPTKGMPLPFVSFGGSSLCFNLIKIGIIINISENNKR